MEGNYSLTNGGRWSPPQSFPAVYLNATENVARSNIDHRFSRHPFTPDDVIEERLPVLIETEVPSAAFVDVSSNSGCEGAGLPKSYPLDGRRRLITHEICQPIGQEAFDVGAPGIACRSATIPKPPYGEELAWFQRANERLPALSTRRFSQWYFAEPKNQD